MVWDIDVFDIFFLSRLLHGAVVEEGENLYYHLSVFLLAFGEVKKNPEWWHFL